MNLLKRQEEDITLTITSVNQDLDSLEVSCEGPGGRYGSVFCSYRLQSFDAEKGVCFTTGRGFPDEGSMIHGEAVGLWRRNGEKIDIKQIVDINNGDQNLDIIIIDMHSKTVKIRPFILEAITDLG
jgi:hypothetical protein